MIRYTKKTFPKKYAIKVDEENVYVLQTWRSVKCNTDELLDTYLLSFYQEAVGYASSTIYKGFTEISFEDFKKFVLNIDEPEEIVLEDKDMKYLIKFLRKLKIR